MTTTASAKHHCWFKPDLYAQNDNEGAAKRALAVLTELYRRNVWRDARTVNVIGAQRSDGPRANDLDSAGLPCGPHFANRATDGVAIPASCCFTMMLGSISGP